jgi:hypothetical protein
MSDLHVVYRLEKRVSPGVPERSATYSYPVSIYVAVRRARSAVRCCAAAPRRNRRRP